MPPDEDPAEPPSNRSALPQTRWSLILEAKEQNPQALSDLCQQYWQPLYAFARRQGKSIEDAQDLTQGFMLRIVSKEFFNTAAPEKGRLRSVLLVSFQNYIRSDHRKQSRQKRGGGTPPVAIDAVSAEAWLAMEPSENVTPEIEFDRQWARGIIRRAKSSLQEAYTEAGMAAEFDAFSDQLEGGSSDRPYQEIADELGVTAAKARYIGFKLRQRFRERLVDVVTDTVAHQGEADEELAYLLQMFEAPS